MKLHIPVEQYGFVEYETPEETSEKEAKAIYDSISNAFRVDTTFEFNEFLVKLFDSDLKEWRDGDYYESLTSQQKEVCQSIKRFLKRRIK